MSGSVQHTSGGLPELVCRSPLPLIAVAVCEDLEEHASRGECEVGILQTTIELKHVDVPGVWLEVGVKLKTEAPRPFQDRGQRE